MKTTRRDVLGLLGATALGGCAAPAIVSQDKNDPFEGGIGGTGIVGVLNGFGSLLINGLRVELDTRTTFRTAFGRVEAARLAPGQLLTVTALRRDGGIVARDVSVNTPLVGTLVQNGSTLSVNGVPLTIEPGAPGAPGAGARVAVSGVWTASGVIASRVDPAHRTQDLIAGTATVSNGALRVGPVNVVSRRRLGLDGQFLTAKGRFVDGRFEADDLETGRFPASATLQLLSVEGYLEPITRAPGFRIAGLGHSFARNVALSGIGARRALYFGAYNGRFGASRGYILPENQSDRRKLLRPGLQAQFDGETVRI